MREDHEIILKVVLLAFIVSLIFLGLSEFLKRKRTIKGTA